MVHRCRGQVRLSGVQRFTRQNGEMRRKGGRVDVAESAQVRQLFQPSVFFSLRLEWRGMGIQIQGLFNVHTLYP